MNKIYFDETYRELVIEEASPEEIAMIEEDLEEFRANPASLGHGLTYAKNTRQNNV